MNMKEMKIIYDAKWNDNEMKEENNENKENEC